MDEITYTIPLVIALAGVGLSLATRGARPQPVLKRIAGLSDLYWCGSALLVKSWILYEGIQGDPGDRVPWLDLGMIAIVLIALLLAPRRLRVWLAFGLTAFVSLWIWSDLLHLRFFGDVMTLATVLATGNTADLSESIRALQQRQDLFLFLDLIPALGLAILLSLRKAPPRPRVFTPEVLVALSLLLPLLVPSLVLTRKLMLSPLSGVRSRVFLSSNLVREYGLLGFHALDARQHIQRLWRSKAIPQEELDEITDWLEARAPLRSAAGPFSGQAAGKNLILIQVESLQSFALSDAFDGLDIMPKLKEIATHGIQFTDVSDQAGVGRTSDAELLSLASLLPAPDRAAAFAYGSNRFAALPGVLREHGYTTLSAVPFTPSFWNRHVTHPAYGFSKSLFRRHFKPGLEIGWGLNDQDFLAQMLNRLQHEKQPFFALLMTLSLHFPYEEWPEELRALPEGVFRDERLRNYLEAMHYADAAIGAFFEGLAERGLLDESIVVVYGDHDSGIQGKDITRFFGFKGRRLNWNLFDTVPLILRLPGDDAPTARIDKAAGLSDLPVTLLALLGIDPRPYPFVGRNLLGDQEGSVVARAKGHWVDSSLYFQTNPEACFDRASRKRVPDATCREGTADDRMQRFVSSRILEYDLQQPLFEELSRRLDRRP